MEICDLGEHPALGDVPEKMHAFLVRQDRFGEPRDAWQREIIPTPEIGPKDVLVYVMATGINYNNVWAALGIPVDVIADRQRKGEPEDFQRPAAAIARASSGRSAARSTTSRSATRSSSTAAGGSRKIRGSSPAATRCSPNRRVSGATRPTTAAIASSPAPSRTNASPSPST